MYFQYVVVDMRRKKSDNKTLSRITSKDTVAPRRQFFPRREKAREGKSRKLYTLYAFANVYVGR